MAPYRARDACAGEAREAGRAGYPVLWNRTAVIRRVCQRARPVQALVHLSHGRLAERRSSLTMEGAVLPSPTRLPNIRLCAGLSVRSRKMEIKIPDERDLFVHATLCLDAAT